MKLLLIFLFFSTQVLAADILLKEFDYVVEDIANLGLKKEDLYNEMKMRIIRTKDSICCNRAHVWAYDFKMNHDLNTPKIFLFYTPKTGDVGPVTWWYHVAPIVNEKGKLWVMDAGYPHRIQSALSLDAWLKEWNGKDSICKKILPGEDDLVELMNRASAFPEVTRYGKHDCYYKIVPHGYWTPRQLAMHLLGKTTKGRPVNFNRNEFNKNEVVQACIETSTNPLGWLFEITLPQCRYFVYRGEHP